MHPNAGAGGESGGGARWGLAIGALVLIWFVVYWLTPAPEASGPRVLFEDTEQGFEAERAAGAVAEPMPVEPTPAAASGGDEEAGGVGIIPPQFEEYTCEKGDNAWSISEKVYGTPGYARRVMNANPLTDFTRLRKGQKIRVPKDPANVQGLPADGSSEPMAPEPAYTEYIVQRNDTLTGIAKALYGRASYWTRIRDANPGKINSSGTNIRPGMTILIPPPPNESR